MMLLLIIVSKYLKTIIERSPRKEDVRLLENEQNIGLAKTRLRGMLEAQGDFVLNTDSDDWVEPNIVSALLKKLMKKIQMLLFLIILLPFQIKSIMQKKYLRRI